YKGATYSEIIEKLFPSIEEQRSFLKKQFEGKTPGKAHKLIAQLVKEGLIRFIVTTNFDSLIEQVLDEAGLRGKYTVISDKDQVLNSKPWNHVEICRVYKIHGTIEQGRIRNTEKDLEQLDPEIGKDYLDVIERHGVIVLGYAGNDKSAMEYFNKRKFTGYTLYWTTHSNSVNYNVKQLLENQDGYEIQIKSASEFLEEILNRVEIAKKGIEQTSESVAQVGFKNLITSSSDVEIKQTIDDERRKLKKYTKEILSQVNENDYKSLWDGYLKIFKYSINFLLLVEQIIKYQDIYWENVVPIFEEIHSLNEKQDRNGKNGIVNYFFFTLLELIGGILLENNSFKNLNFILNRNRLRNDRMEDILSWNIQAQFIEVKNKEEKKETKQEWIVPHMHYLLQLVESQDIPFDFNLRKRILDVDLIFFVHTVVHPRGEHFPYWFPRSSVYMRGVSSDILKRIKLDNQFADKVSNELFEITPEELINQLRDARNHFNEFRDNNIRFVTMNNPFNDFE
ncbi:MAG: SIR2 family protein, partial [Spirochaetes bacterium]|nr:SIR2 family protein [Spirochaetota bacterium]